MSPAMKRRSTTVTVAVIAGSVAFHFDDLTGVLDGGMGTVFAGEQATAAGPPDGMKGFIGMLQGEIVGKTNNSFVLQVEKVVKAWPRNKAANPEASVGKRIRFRVRDRHKAIVRVFAKLKVGDRVVAGSTQGDGDFLVAVEVLAKAEELPALQAKWERQRKEREARRRQERERREGQREGADR